MLFCTFLCRRCTTLTWKCLISRFVEDLNTRQRLCFRFLHFETVFKDSTLEKWLKHSTHWTKWIKSDKDWGSVNPLFKWCFRNRRRRCCLSSLLWSCCTDGSWCWWVVCSHDHTCFSCQNPLPWSIKRIDGRLSIRCGHTSDFTHGQISVAHGEAIFGVWPISRRWNYLGEISMDTSKRTKELPMTVPEVSSVG